MIFWEQKKNSPHEEGAPESPWYVVTTHRLNLTRHVPTMKTFDFFFLPAVRRMHCSFCLETKKKKKKKIIIIIMFSPPSKLRPSISSRSSSQCIHHVRPHPHWYVCLHTAITRLIGSSQRKLAASKMQEMTPSSSFPTISFFFLQNL